MQNNHLAWVNTFTHHTAERSLFIQSHQVNKLYAKTYIKKDDPSLISRIIAMMVLVDCFIVYVVN